jgi:hypothetical protein
MGFMPPAEGNGVTILRLDDGRWNACDPCAAYVDRGEVTNLANHVVSAFYLRRSNPMVMTPEGRRTLRKMLRSQYAALVAAGPAKHPFG